MPFRETDPLPVKLVKKWDIAEIGRWNKVILSVLDG
jgi:hypothetical protein